MGSRVEDVAEREGKDGDGEVGWMRVYRAWEEARDGVYHLFMAWIRYVYAFSHLIIC